MEKELIATELTINLRKGFISAKGTESFVQSIYNDFKERITKASVSPTLESAAEHEAIAPKTGERSRRQRSAPKSDNGKNKAGTYRPAVKPDLDLTPLGDFYDQFDPSTHSEKILIFTTFLRDVLKIEPCAADDVFSCYFALRHRTDTPKAFVQAIRDAQNKFHFVEFASPQEIRVTTVGNNHFNRTLKKKGTAE